MSQTELLAIVAALFSLCGLLIGVIWKIVRAEIASMNTRFEQWTKDKEKFDYEFRHNQYVPAINAINLKLWPLAEKVENVETRVDELKEWKHLTVDAYIPRAVDEHERRINRLDAKVFNGGGK